MADLKYDYEKELKRIQALIRVNELRGYTFKTNIIPDTPKEITSKAVEDLRKIDYNYVKSQAQRPSAGIKYEEQEVKPPRIKHENYYQTTGLRGGVGNPQNLQQGRGKTRKARRIYHKKARVTGVKSKPFAEKHTITLSVPKAETQTNQPQKKPTTRRAPLRDTASIMIYNFKNTLKQYSNAVGAIYVENLIDRLIEHYGREIVAEILAEIGNDVSYETFYDYSANNKFMNEILNELDKRYDLQDNDPYFNDLRERTNNIDDFGDYALAQENKYVRLFGYRGYVNVTNQVTAEHAYDEAGVSLEARDLGASQKQIDRYAKAVAMGLIEDAGFTGEKSTARKDWAFALDRVDKRYPNWEI